MEMEKSEGGGEGGRGEDERLEEREREERRGKNDQVWLSAIKLASLFLVDRDDISVYHPRRNYEMIILIVIAALLVLRR